MTNSPSFSRRLTFSRYRHPERWAAVRRGAMVLGAIGGLALARRRAGKGLAKAFQVSGRVLAKRQRAKALLAFAPLAGAESAMPSPPGAWRRFLVQEGRGRSRYSYWRRHKTPIERAVRTLKTTTRAGQKITRKKRMLGSRIHVLKAAMAATGTLGLGYSAMPWAHKRGERNYIERVRREYLR